MSAQVTKNPEFSRHESFFRKSAEASALTSPTGPRDFEGCIPRLGPVIHNISTGALGTRGVLLYSGGRPGYLYAQIPLDREKQYTDLGWDRVVGGDGNPLPTYTIRGPAGAVDCVLLAVGQPIPGLTNSSMLADCLVHDDIPLRTGIANGPEPADEQLPKKEAGKSAFSQMRASEKATQP